MLKIKSQLLPFERMTREPEHNFFGYYDLQPWSGDGRFHLCHRVGFMDRMQAATDRAEIGMIRMTDCRFIPLAETYAWNFQQGTMLQWNPRKPDEEIIFNSFLSGAFRCVVRNISTGATRILPRAVANVSLDGKRALSINFSRLFDFRPGYGYAGPADPFAQTPAPEDDGIYLMDMQTGKDKLIIPISAMSELLTAKFGPHMKGSKLLVNHITFNNDGTRFLFLVRNMPMPGRPVEGWLTLAATADISGGDIHVLEAFGGASHYIWRDPEHLLIYADMPGPGKMALCLAKDRSSEFKVLDPSFFAFDGHCSYSPDKNFILYDSYPDADGYRRLLLYDLRKGKGYLLAELLSAKERELPHGDVRCDLHPRWNRDGSAISFDSIHESHRHIYWMALKDIL